MPTHSQRPTLSIVWTTHPDVARLKRDEGFCPVECSFGDESVLDSLAMDHHGRESGREPVSIRAWRDHRGARAADPRFVVTGSADADATFAIAALAGMLPDASSGMSSINDLARCIGEMDMDPFQRPAGDDPVGLTVLLHNRLASPIQDASSFHAGIERWRWILLNRDLNPWLELVRSSEAERRTLAAAAHIELLGPEVAVVQSPVWGWDVWYAQVRPIIVAHVESARRISIGCRDIATANALLGNGGLLRVFPELEPQGWGGRETIGGSPRGIPFELNDAMKIGHQVQTMIQRCR